ncbi:MAG: phosphoribosylamine--glycine ligase [Deltaproteobacteria bacterium]|nr:phosphoribosylamine--glycine ligase [Deltaproteobacteria bacterium]
MGYKVLLVGSGGREHALAWRLVQSPLCDHLLVAPGNPGIEALGRGMGQGRVTLAKIATEAIADLVALGKREAVDLVVCGPEVPLMAGLGDACQAAGLRCFGPSRKAAEIEGSKQFAKEIMTRAGVPTAAYGAFSDVAAADAFIDAQPGDLVVKADGLCAGKGVVVTASHDEAKRAVRTMLVERAFGEAGGRVVIEERLGGREVSMMALCDGTRFVLLASAEDHKTVLDGDRGPNTGGMGAYSPSPLVDEALTEQIARTIFAPLLAALADAGRPFRGLLYGGLMLSPERGPTVIEWNCRFGDPETQAVLLRLGEDLLPWLLDAASGELPMRLLEWLPGLAVCVVLAAEGYPGKVRGGDRIAGLGDDGQLPGAGGDLVVFHAGTKRGDGGLLTSGGRVLGVTAYGGNLEEARERVYAGIGRIGWPGMHYRKDIGLRGKS